MPKAKIEKDARIVYYAEGGAGTAYRGPFPAIVENVYPIDKERKSEPPNVDLRVYFNGLDGQAHTKTNVAYALEPTKHHYGEVPADWPWPDAKKEEPAE